MIVFTTDGFPGQATRPPPVADEGRVAWRSGQNRQRRTGAPDDFGHRKRATEVQIPPPQPTMRTDLDIGARNPVTTTVTGFFYPIFSSETQ